MRIKVINTIYSDDLEFGEELLDGIDADLINGRWLDEESLITHSTEADAIICSGPIQAWTPRVIRSLSKCRILASLGIGYDSIHLETATEMGMVVTNIPDYCIDEVSSQAMALTLALGRKLFQIDKIVREQNINFVPPRRGNITSHLAPVYRSRAQTFGILGLGKIGTATALKAQGLGFRVIAYDPYVLDEVMRSRGVEPVDFDTLLQEADYVSLHAWLSDETRHMFGSEAFRKMKPSAFLINTARGEIVDQDALVRALQENRLAGAGLDVTADDPISKENPMLAMDNVIFSGHSAWYSTTSDSGVMFWHKAMGQVIQSLGGQWPTYAVNPEAKRRWLKRWGR
jgi:D-3-phosphoglycerate dehydrogenase / 2-oxoglutarate reductase